MTDRGLFVGLLGPLVVRRDGRDVRIGSGKQQLVLGALAAAGRALSTDELVDVLWGDEVPATAVGTLQTHVSRLRALIGPDALVDVGAGYRLELGDGHLDATRFTTLVASARAARDRGEQEPARRDLRRGLALWRGPALATYRYEPFAQLEVARLEALRVEAIEDRCELDIQAGDNSVVTELEALTVDNPFRERLTLLLMHGLYRAGRQAEALHAVGRLRHALRDDLGIDPTAEVDALERRILEHDPALSAAVQDPLPRRYWHMVMERTELPAPAPAGQCDQLIDQAVALRRAGRLTESRSSAAAAIRLASALDDHHRLGAAALALAGPPEDAVLGEPLDTDLLERALAGLKSDDSLTPMLRARLAVGCIDAGDTDRGNTMLATAEADAFDGSDAQVQLYVLRARHRTWFDPAALGGRLALATRIADLAAESGEVADRAWASRWLAIDLLEAGDLQGFDRTIEQLADANERIHDPFHQWGVVARRAGKRASTGPLDEADALTMEAMNLASSIGSDYTLAATSGLLFVLRWRQQRLQELDGLVQDLAAREPLVRPLLPLFHLELGRHDEARQALHELTRPGLRDVFAADPVGAVRLMALTTLSQASFHLDDQEAAAQLLDELAPIQATMAVLHPGITVLAPVAELRAAVLGCLGKLDEAISQAEAAARTCARTDCVAAGVRANALLALLLRRRGRSDDNARASQVDHEVQRQAQATGAVPPAWHAAPAV